MTWKRVTEQPRHQETRTEQSVTSFAGILVASAIAVIARDQVIAVIGNRAGPSLPAQKRGISALTLHYSEFDSDLTYADPVPQSMVSESLQNWQGYRCTSNPPIVKNSPIQAISQATTS